MHQIIHSVEKAALLKGCNSHLGDREVQGEPQQFIGYL